MGLLVEGRTLPWPEAKKYATRIKESGVTQLLHNWKARKHMCIESFVWGDEIESMVVRFDHENKRVMLYSAAHEYVGRLLEIDGHVDGSYEPWKPEYASYMLESTPAEPYEDSLDALTGVEGSMMGRRAKLESVAGKDIALITMTGFPRLGCPGFLYPGAIPTPLTGESRSIFTPPESINPHVRFKTMTNSIRQRRGRKCVSNVPIYRDRNTQDPFIEMLPNPYPINGHAPVSAQLVPIMHFEPEARPDSVYVDSMCFGMGCCCLQATFQACGMRQCRVMYDQLTPMAALMHAISAANPIVRGYLVNTDTRWAIISDAVDDRTDEERGILPLKENKYRLRKSRYSTVSYYISSGSDPDPACLEKLKKKPSSAFGGRYYTHDFFKKEYNDVDQTIDKAIYHRLKSEKLDEGLSVHYAHIFTRDPLVVYEDSVYNSAPHGSNEFENIQSTNWQTLRFKPPPPTNSPGADSVGWRVEFRSMEIQFTDKENAYLVIYANLLARVVLFFNLDLLIPISMSETNMERAQKFNSVATQKYFFRSDINYPPVNTDPEFFEKYFGHSEKEYGSDVVPNLSGDILELTINEIFNGAPSTGFIGINKIVEKYLLIKKEMGAVSHAAYDYLLGVVDFVRKRANLEIPTNAMWIRSFVRDHSAYKFDSVVSDEIAYDLCKEIHKMSTTLTPRE